MQNNQYELSVVDIANLLDVTRQAVPQLFKNRAGAAKSNKKFSTVPPQSVREFLQTSRGYNYKKQSIAFQIVKGGVGKSSLSKNFAIRASMYGYKTLLIDFLRFFHLLKLFLFLHLEMLILLIYFLEYHNQI